MSETNMEDQPSQSRADRSLSLSSLMDGELSAHDASLACTDWRTDPQARADWHAWHVAGDVLRSDELAGAALRDQAFLARLHEAMVNEPVVLAPVPSVPTLEPRRGAFVAGAGRVRQWGAPAAVAAGFMLVVGALVSAPVGTSSLLMPSQVAQQGGGAGNTLASSSAPYAQSGLAQSWAGESGEPVAVGENGLAVVRDVRFDRYLAAHQQFSGSTALGNPSGFMRVASHDVSGR